MKKRIPNKQRSEETSTLLINVGQKLFRTHGYSGISQEEIVKKAGMTRGALYHHFDGKKGLFKAVFEDSILKIASRVKMAENRTAQSWDNFISCTYEFCVACLDSDLQRIVLIDGPVVLGWNVWRKIDERETMGILNSHLKILLEDEVIHSIPLELLTHFISGAVNESILWISGTNDPRKAFDETWPSLKAILSTLKK
jgi:AcrR family transcriptional regulator